MLLASLTSSVRRRRRPADAPARRGAPLANGLVAVIQQQDFGADLVTRTPDDTIHVSEIINFCARRRALMLKDKIEARKAVRPADRIMWAIGRAVEFHVRTQLTAGLGYEAVLGRWTCPCEHITYEGTHDHNRVCPRCHKSAHLYGEITLYDTELRIVGHPDFLIYIDAANLIRIIEIKSMNKTEFDELLAPKANHVFQAGAYRRMAAKLYGEENVDTHVTIIYACKDYSFKGGPYKEHSVNVTEGQIKDTLDLAWNTVAEYRAANEKTLAPRLCACACPTSVFAKQCPAVTSCFSRRS